jgi:hypothetical protein
MLYFYITHNNGSFQIVHQGGFDMKHSCSYAKMVFSVFLLTVTSLYSFSQTPSFQAYNDTIDLYPGIPVVYDILANDSIPANDTIRTIMITGMTSRIGCQKTHDSAWKWTFTFTVYGWGFGGELHGGYKLYTMSMDTTSAKILFRIHDNSYNYLEINNVRARLNASGNHFFYENADYEVPKGSGKTSIFSNAFWIGGKDVQGNLHFAGERYRQGPTGGPAGTKPDFYAGPVMDSIHYSIYQDTVWNYVWNLKKTDIDFHRLHYWEPGYAPIHDILTWPGNGNVALGQAHRLAPFSDRNGDGIYDPADGDYPEIRGDQALFFIFNDDRGPHLETTGPKLRVEIHGMAYAFDMPEDSALNNTTFLNYKMYNRSQNTYDSTLLGVFTDIDLGYASDDYIGCDVERSMYFGYNGPPIDGNGQSYAYGANPPVQSVTILAGPYMDPDGIDNPRYGSTGSQLCDFSVNGVYFGDTIVDNERFGMQKFLYFNNSNSGIPAYMTDPDYYGDYYQLLCGKWKDGSPLVYGGNGHPSAGGYGPACSFMFPGESDTLNWGVGCVPPNGPVNWTETTAANNPQDRRGLGVTGPFTFGPGEVQDLDLAFSWARDYGDHGQLGSLAKLRLLTDGIRTAFATNMLPNGNPFYSINDPQRPAEIPIKVFPNPASDYVNIVYGDNTPSSSLSVELMNSQGNCLKKVVMSDHLKSFRLDISGIPAGFYYIRLAAPKSVSVKKVVVIH